MLIRTYGSYYCIYSPFSVLPKSAYLSPKEKIDVRVTFKTMHLGETHGILNAMFETGDVFVMYQQF